MQTVQQCYLAATAATAATTTAGAFAACLGAILEHVILILARLAVHRPLATLNRSPFVDAGRWCMAVRLVSVRSESEVSAANKIVGKPG